jgi:DNA-directed RNA polymerase sigma subunit (sigma70/sigma32)
MPNKALYSAGKSFAGLPSRLDKTHLQECVFQAVQSLPARLATVVMLDVYGENGQMLTRTEIGRHLGVGDERVRQLLNNAYKILRQKDQVRLIHQEQGSKPYGGTV